MSGPDHLLGVRLGGKQRRRDVADRLAERCVRPDRRREAAVETLLVGPEREGEPPPTAVLEGVSRHVDEVERLEGVTVPAERAG